ncbi:dipeptide/oligopeptide/nickel ABC transporter permease/ATP-binding protein [Streptomyces sp. NBC_01754]|uniref:dipeptide/oligopeptide/nickel ABC transporter permease/ATP-binding protein n=1 Tax=Streptomyces sp. NBC_01754 TaxID=2975930 RepID=UPI002DD84CCC|nr:dipeptide/oligopeptide/nickel ABC transporter permease/ATP-binding protein [Streptomyces sp. NBC_01754]WSC96149.1 dipeptide/oligopeptide/nickel ABC transporter permease/ATP-binding protein [Streptomyces sp. NBC_01754]
MTAPLPPSGSSAGGGPPTPRRQRLTSRLLRSPMAAVSSAILLVLALATLLAPWIAPFDANTGDISRALEGPGGEYLLGTDSAGRDVLSRLLYGGRTTLGGALLALLVAAGLGVATGLVSGYTGKKFDLGAEWVNNLLMALPNVMVLLAVRAAFGSDVWLSMAVLGVLLAPGFHRLSRNIVMGVRNELYVDAARVSGLSDRRIMVRHVLNSVRAPLIIHAALTAVAAIGIQAGLEFIGLADTSVPAWGTMLNEALVNLYVAPELMLWPGIALGLVNAALILFGNGLRDALEDRPSRRRRKRAGADTTVAAGPTGGRAQPAARNAESGDTQGPSAGGPETGTWAERPDAVLSVRGLTIGYPVADGHRVVVDDVSFDVRAGEVLGLVGESGSGKTQTAWALLDLLPSDAAVLRGSITYQGERLDTRSTKERRRLLGTGIAYVPQEPMSNLDPAFTVGSQLAGPMRRRLGLDRAAAETRALDLLDRVGIADPVRTYRSYPHQISGGMAQRVLIAGAVSCDPRVLVADEPTTALDVTVQAEVLDLLRDLQKERGMAMVMVTHNLGVVADICDRVAVMRLGELVEQNDVDSLFGNPRHPYTRMMLDSVLEGKPPRTPLLGESAGKELAR